MTWWHYLLLVNFYLVLFFGFYALLLRRETFFQLNRVYLVAAALLSFVIPVIEADWVKNLFITQEVQHTIYSMPIGIPVIFVPVVETGITLGEVLNTVYINVTLLLLIRLGWQLLVLKKAIEKPTPSAAYTFFKKISLGENVAHSKVIHDHEKVHASQWHSVDVMIIETVMIINWFNPVVYLYRFAIKYIHEFIADSHVIRAGTNKAEYAMLLLTQSFDVAGNNLVTQFYNHSLLKKRIQMLQKNKSHRIALAKYGLSAPLFIMMMVLSSATVNNSKAVTVITEKTENVLALPATEVIESIADNAQIPSDNFEQETKAIVELPFGLYNVQPVDLPAGMAPVDNSEVFSQVSKQPMFPGGLEAFGKFIGNTVVYPASDRENGTSGKVIVSFVVEKDGSLSNFNAVRGPSEEMKAEAVRILKLSPKWEPGIQNDKPVRVSYTVPIAFMLESEDDERPEFPGGLRSFGKFLGNNIKYPTADRKAGIQGKVIVSYVIETDGALSDIKAIRAPSQSLADEVIRVIKKSPKWKPGTKDDKPARVAFVTPITFSLEMEDGNDVVPVTTSSDVSSTSEAKPVEVPSDALSTGEVVIRGYIKRNASTATPGDDNTIFSQVEKQPEFPMGLPALGKFIADNIRYPKADKEAGVTGKVIVSFAVEPDGSLNDIKAIRGPSQAMMDEAVLVLSKSPKWQPGYQNGKPVRVSYTVPIQFNLDADHEKPNTTNSVQINPGTTVSVTGGGVRIGGGSPTSPLYVIDGEILDAKTAAKYGFDQAASGISPLSLIKQEDVVSMEILKDGTATAIYGDRGNNGVILINTKNKKGLSNLTANPDTKATWAIGERSNPTEPAAGISSNNTAVVKRVITKKALTNPLYVIDGKIVNAEVKNGKRVSPLKKIPQADIISMEILKDENAIKKYGNAGKAGVIIVTTKKAKK